MLTQKDRISGIYYIENIKDHKKYIGQSHNMYLRQGKHISELNSNRHFNEHLQKAWIIDGQRCFDFVVLEYCDAELLDERERYYIDLYDATNHQYGYNMSGGGQINKAPTSDEILQRLSKAIKESYTSELRHYQSVRLTEAWKNPEMRELFLKGGMHGRHHTEETKQRLSKMRMGVSVNMKYKDKVLCVETGIVYDNACVAAKTLSLDSSSVVKVCKGERYMCGGFHWQFVK